MIIVKIIGGLGNQMFQYAYAKALQKKGNKVKIDISAFESYKLHGGYQLNKYNIDLESSTTYENKKYHSTTFLSKILKKLNFFDKKTIKEKSLLFDSSFLDVSSEKFITGYFQSEKYFRNIKDVLFQEFTIKQELSNYTKEMKEKISHAKNSCSIHIRRGDFLNKQNASIHGACSLSYYKDAINYWDNQDMNYFIFSDDIEWARKNLKLENTTYINDKEKRLPHEDIYLMSICQNNIIANSSFSWWGAWLNQNKRKTVIAPKIWFADKKMQKQSKNIVCDGWIKL